MTSKLQNRIKRILYRPAKKSPSKEYIAKKLDEAENALDATIGGVLGTKKKPKKKKDDKKEDKK